MKEKEVPQDNAKAFEGQKKPLYVLSADGNYKTALSSGWDVEEVVLNQAIDQFEQQCEAARIRVENGLASPLEYHMYRCRMDVSVLAQSSGFFRWQVRKHLKPEVFKRLPMKKLKRYEEALGLTVEELQSLPAISPSEI